VGDNPLIGCGCYADDLSAGASATGWGESIMKVVLCKTACDLTAQDHDAQSATEKAIGVLADRAQGLGGLIMIDHAGQIGQAFNTPRMARAWIENGQVIAKVDK
jgi:beta-aspartyl-peptidase (threonine type)